MQHSGSKVFAHFAFPGDGQLPSSPPVLPSDGSWTRGLSSAKQGTWLPLPMAQSRSRLVNSSMDALEALRVMWGISSSRVGPQPLHPHIPASHYLFCHPSGTSSSFGVPIAQPYTWTPGKGRQAGVCVCVLCVCLYV